MRLRRLAALPPLYTAAFALAAYAMLFNAMLRHRHWDPTSFIVAGEDFTARGALVSPIKILPHSSGYDGQFYYRLALDPFTSKAQDFGITLDDPATRGGRIGYPFLAWLASLGRPGLLPWALIGVNLAGLAVIAWASAALVRARGLPGWLGLGAAFYPGFLLTLARDTTEIAATALGMTALSLACRRRFWWAALPACCAVVTRETTLFYLAGFGLTEAVACLRRRRWSWNLVPLASPAGVYVAWQAVTAWHWGRLSTVGVAKDFGLPFAGIAAFLVRETDAMRDAGLTLVMSDYHRASLALGVLCLVLFGMAGIAALRRPGTDLALKITYVGYLLLAVCLGGPVWNEPYGYMRALTECFAVGATVVSLSGRAGLTVEFYALAAVMWAIEIPVFS